MRTATASVLWLGSSAVHRSPPNRRASTSAALAIPRGAFQLRITQAGSLDALKFASVEREAPAPGQVEIEVHATGLNFSDVLKALGLYPGIKDSIVPLGIEASGVVTAVGEGVDRFKVGDEVFGVAPYAFASHTRTAEYALVHKPRRSATTKPARFRSRFSPPITASCGWPNCSRANGC